mgnify:CR=1 FL=1
MEEKFICRINHFIYGYFDRWLFFHRWFWFWWKFRLSNYPRMKWFFGWIKFSCIENIDEWKKLSRDKIFIRQIEFPSFILSMDVIHWWKVRMKWRIKDMWWQQPKPSIWHISTGKAYGIMKVGNKVIDRPLIVVAELLFGESPCGTIKGSIFGSCLL